MLSEWVPRSSVGDPCKKMTVFSLTCAFQPICCIYALAVLSILDLGASEVAKGLWLGSVFEACRHQAWYATFATGAGSVVSLMTARPPRGGLYLLMRAA